MSTEASIQPWLREVDPALAARGRSSPPVRIVDVRREGDTWVGETEYHTPEGRIGLRSIWEQHDGTWKAAALENF